MKLTGICRFCNVILFNTAKSTYSSKFLTLINKTEKKCTSTCKYGICKYNIIMKIFINFDNKYSDPEKNSVKAMFWQKNM